VLLTITYGQSSGGLQRGVSTIFSPLQDVADRALKPARDLVDWFDKTFDARGENSQLKEELVKTRQLAVGGQVALQENEQFRKLFKLDRESAIAATDYTAVTGRVIARTPTLLHSAVTIDLGSDDGVKVDDSVLSGDGLVGRVASVEGSSSQVTLITDHASAISAKVVPNGVQGVIRPDLGDPEDLILDYIDSTQNIGVGQAVVTSGWCAQGLCSIFPPNLPVGEVTRASLIEQKASQQVRLRPYADLADLDLVQVLTGGPKR
jgi:rod shape-determining protein MreC